MFNFCIKADRHLGSCFSAQLECCSRLLINNIEIDNVIDGVSLVEMSGCETERIRGLLIGNCKKIVLLNCGFSGYDAERINLLFRKAHLLGVECVNIALPEEPAVLEGLLTEILPIAGSYGIGVALENRRQSRLAAEESIAALFRRFKDEPPCLVFNPLEFTAEKRHPFFHVFYNTRLKPDIRYLRVNDGLFVDGSPALTAQGNAEIKELASALLARSYKGYFSFHPYMPGMDLQRYEEVIGWFKKLLMEM